MDFSYINTLNAAQNHGPPKPTFLEVFMVNNLVFRWPKPLFFMVLGAHGIFILVGQIIDF